MGVTVPGQVAPGQQFRYHRDFVGFAVDCGLAQDIGAVVAHRTDQEGVLAVGAGAVHVLAIDRLAVEDLALRMATLPIVASAASKAWLWAATCCSTAAMSIWTRNRRQVAALGTRRQASCNVAISSAACCSAQALMVSTVVWPAATAAATRANKYAQAKRWPRGSRKSGTWPKCANRGTRQRVPSSRNLLVIDLTEILTDGTPLRQPPRACVNCDPR